MDKTKILVVDDEKEICELTKSFLARRNYETFTATNSQEAIGLTQKEQPQVVLLDIRLGSESGMDVLRKIKEINGSIRVIMITALDDEASIRQARSLGADDYITKPFTTKYLNDFILQKIATLNIQPKK